MGYPLQISFARGTLVFTTEQPRSILNKLHDVKWDSRVGILRAPACSYARVVAGLKNSNFTFDDEVQRQRLPLQGSWRKIPLRPYQEHAREAWLAHQGMGLAVLPTGAGKTRFALACAAKVGLSTLIVVPTRVLLEQWDNDLKLFFDGPVGKLGDGERTVRSITVATYESALRHMPQLGVHFGTLIIDEVHHFGGRLKDEILEMAAAPHRLGLTGTLPQDGAQVLELERLVGPVVYQISVHDLTGKYLANYEHFQVRLLLSPAERQSYDREYRVFKRYLQKINAEHPSMPWTFLRKLASRSREGQTAMSALNRARSLLTYPQSKKMVLKSLLDQVQGEAHKMLIFTADTSSAYQVSKDFLVPALTAAISRKERQEILDAFKDGFVRTLVSCRVLNEGLNVPDADIAVILGGTLGQREHFQRIGRLLRPSPGKKARVYELIIDGSLEVNIARRRNQPLDS